MNTLFKSLISRLKERSTWIGLTTLMASLGINFKPEVSEAVVTAGIGLVGLILVVTKDTKTTDNDEQLI